MQSQQHELGISDIQREAEQSISIIIPCFNESEGIEFLKTKLNPVLEKLRSSRFVELILVDDGSTDNTFRQMQHSFNQQAKLVRHECNQGIMAAIQTGLIHSTGKIICTLDSDCTYDPTKLPELLTYLSDDVDIVTGSPYHPEGNVKNVPGWRLFLSKGLSRIYAVVLPQKLYTYTSMFRAYRREAIETLPNSYPGFLGLVEVVAEAILRGDKVVEYPAQLNCREFGQSKLRVTKVILSHLKYIGKLIVQRL